MPPTELTELFDVVAVNMDSNLVRLLAQRKSEKNAEAIINMAVMRRGLDTEFFSECRTGKYKDGDEWTGKS